jgi:hypothetical protein
MQMKDCVCTNHRPSAKATKEDAPLLAMVKMASGSSKSSPRLVMAKHPAQACCVWDNTFRIHGLL